MDFSFSEEQTLLRNSVRRFVQDRYDLDQRRKIVGSETGMAPENWTAFAELGLLAAPFDEDHGGLGGSAIETMIVMEEFGRGLVVEPYMPTVIQCGGLLRHGGSEEQKQTLIPAITKGELKLALAYFEPQSRFNLADVKTTAEREGDEFTLTGSKSVVLGGPHADKFIISARTRGEQRQSEGLTLFVVDRNAEGLSTRDYPTIDGLRALELDLQNVTVNKGAVIGEVDQGYGLLERMADESIAALCAEALGCMAVLNGMTVEYCRSREQFGQPIGNFQVLQHRMVDMFMAYEQSVSMTYMVTLKLDDNDVERRKAASAAKVQIGRAGKFIGQSAVQLHGAMGMTDEMAVGHYFKRLTMIDAALGNVDFHLKRFADAA